MSDWRIYHNPGCSKSRAALHLLEAHGIVPTVIRYLESPLDVPALDALLRQLGVPARTLLRTGEREYRSLRLDAVELDEAALLAAMAAHPSLIERPVVARGDRAVIARPAERLLTLLG